MSPRQRNHKTPPGEEPNAKAIMDYARNLFDSVGVATHPETRETILILGLATGPERDLDDFERTDSGVTMQGFAKHAAPRQQSLIHFIREQGFEAEPVGRLGYPRGEELQLKRAAVSAGLGLQGKNTLVLHPTFGPWIRFMALRTNAPLQPTGPGSYERREPPECDGCQLCIEVCPVDIMKPYHLVKTNECLSGFAYSHCRFDLWLP